MAWWLLPALVLAPVVDEVTVYLTSQRLIRYTFQRVWHRFVRGPPPPRASFSVTGSPGLLVGFRELVLTSSATELHLGATIQGLPAGRHLVTYEEVGKDHARPIYQAEVAMPEQTSGVRLGPVPISLIQADGEDHAKGFRLGNHIRLVVTALDGARSRVIYENAPMRISITRRFPVGDRT